VGKVAAKTIVSGHAKFRLWNPENRVIVLERSPGWQPNNWNSVRGESCGWIQRNTSEILRSVQFGTQKWRQCSLIFDGGTHKMPSVCRRN
jgi:hypothetical protein